MSPAACPGATSDQSKVSSEFGKDYADDVFANIVIDQFEMLRIDPAKLSEFFKTRN